MDGTHTPSPVRPGWRPWRGIFAGLALCAACMALHAAPPSADSVRKLLEVTQSAALVEQSFATVEQMARQGLQQEVAGKKLTDEQRRALDLAPARIAAVVKEEMSWRTLEPIFVAIYQEAFDQEEIDALIAFHQSPVGQSYVSKMPLVMTRTLQVMQSQMQALTPRIKRAMDEVLREARLQPKT